ncbi:MAG TPA: hypothetical protein VKE70_23510 [Candidatus Solibacter sp.]|nr:hypothetical protein [Candidatus Solibacter sp.]
MQFRAEFLDRLFERLLFGEAKDHASSGFGQSLGDVLIRQTLKLFDSAKRVHLLLAGLVLRKRIVAAGWDAVRRAGFVERRLRFERAPRRRHRYLRCKTRLESQRT